MTRIAGAILLVLTLACGPAAADSYCRVPLADWQPREAVAKLAQDRGWTVRRIKIDDGCYEIDGRDAQGHRIEVTVHPATLDVISIEREEGKEKEEED